MKNILFVLVLMGSIYLGGCSYSWVEGGQEAFMKYKLWIFGHGGVDPEPIKTGAVYTVWSTSVDRYNIKPKQYNEAFVDLIISYL